MSRRNLIMCIFYLIVAILILSLPLICRGGEVHNKLKLPVDRAWHLLFSEVHEFTETPNFINVYYEVWAANHNGYNTRFSTKCTVNGIEIAMKMGRNITPGAHYDFHTRMAQFGSDKVYSIIVYGLAASTASQPGDKLKIAKGKLIVTPFWYGGKK